MARWRYVLPALLVLAACEGPMGPPGEDGAARLTFSGTLDQLGQAIVTLPAEAGTLTDPPAVTCYVGQSTVSGFRVIGSDDDTGMVCSIAEQGGVLYVGVAATPGWLYRVVVVY